MSTYYGYAERDADSQIDWSVIGRDINKKLKDEVDRRDKLKADIEEKSREYQEILNNVPVGADESATKNAIAYTQDAAEYKLGLTKALKFGDMNVKKYLQATNSLRIDTEGAFVMYKNYQKYNDQKIARMDSKDPKTRGNVLESALYKHTGGYLNMRNARPFIDATGRVLYARMDKDGNRVIGEEGKYPPISIPMMNNYITSEIASFDVDKAVDETTKSIGTSTITVERQMTEGGGLQTQQITITDKTQELLKDLYEQGWALSGLTPSELKTYIDKYEAAKKAKVDFYMGNDNNVVDYLVRMGIGYEPTFDEDEFKEDGKMILVKQDPDTDGYELVFPKGAKDEAKQALSDAIDAKQASLVQTKTTSLFTQPKDPAKEKEKKQYDTTKGKVQNADFLTLLFYGNDSQKQQSLNKLKSLNRRVIKAFKWVENDTTGQVDLKVDVFDDTNPKGWVTQDFLSDFNNRSVEDMMESVLKDEYSNIFDKNDQGAFKKSMMNALTNQYKDFGLKKSRLVKYHEKGTLVDPDDPTSGMESADSDVTTAEIIPWQNRTVATLDGGVTGNPSVVLNELVSNDQKAATYTQAINISYLATPKGESDEIVPLADALTIRPLTADDINKKYGINQSYEAGEFTLDPEYFDGPRATFLIPVWNTTFQSTDGVMQLLEKRVSDIKAGKKVKKITLDEIRNLMTYTRTGRRNDNEWFDIYNPQPEGEMD